jgi:hypothetical protein
MTHVAEYQELKRLQHRNPTHARARRIRELGKRKAGRFADLSSNNGPKTQEDFRRYARQGANVVGIKATEGTHYVNPYFAEQVQLALEVGLLVLPYHFARPDQNPNGAAAEASHFVKVCREAGLYMGRRHKHWFNRTNLPGCLDYEVGRPGGGDRRWIKRFQHAYVAHTGHGYALRSPGSKGPLLYGGSVIRERVTMPLRLLFWLAAYTESPDGWWPLSVPKRFRFAWQYTDKAHLGLGQSDGSRLYRNISELLRLAV